MSNCYSSQAEYDDHDFKDGICKDCGQVDKPAVKALSAQVSMLERKVTELAERNRRLANQIRGYSDRVNDSLSQVIKNAKAEALREAADKFQTGDWFNVIQGNAHVKIGNGQRVTDWLRARADKLDTL